MKNFTLVITLFFALSLFVAGCGGKADGNAANIAQDSVAITDLVRQMYKWRETTPQKEDFPLKTNAPSDTLYAGLDKALHQERVKELEASKFFTKGFIENYDKIAQFIDAQLTGGKAVWLVGDLSPFRAEGNPWCNCQDSPDKYWEKLTVNGLVFDKDNASFNWTLGDDFSGTAKATKENGAWKISQLEGFDYALYAGSN